MEVQLAPHDAAPGTGGLFSPRTLRMASDARLVALVRAHNRTAFEVLHERYYPQLLSFCRHILRDREEAADAVQHTFLAAYDAITSSDRPILLRPWLFTIARNRCFTMLRRRPERPVDELTEPATEGLATHVQRREELRHLLDDMRALPPEQRAALVLAELGTMSHQQIGVTLEVPPTKVKALVFQARESLLASRAARDTDCSDIRLELESAQGGALRRANLRRHLRQCAGCRDFRTEVELRRRGLAELVPSGPVLIEDKRVHA